MQFQRHRQRKKRYCSLPTVQCLPCNAGTRTAVHIIPGQRMADGSHMHADLMGTAGFQSAAHQRMVAIKSQRFVMCHRRLTFSHTTLYGMPRQLADGRIHRAGLRDFTFAHGEIELLHPGRGGSVAVFGSDQKAGSVFVQPVQRAKGSCFSPFGVIAPHSLGKAVVFVPGGGVHRHTGRFIDYKKIVIFV